MNLLLLLKLSTALASKLEEISLDTSIKGCS